MSKYGQIARRFFYAFPSRRIIAATLRATLFIAGTTAMFGQQSSPYTFLRTETNARAAAMAGAFISIPGDIGAFFYNPASVNTIDSNELSFTFTKHILDVNAGALVYGNQLASFGINDNGTAALGINYINYGSFERTDNNGVVQGTFGGFDLVMSLGYANNLDTNWHYGIAMAYIVNRLENTGSGALTLSAGMLYEIPKSRTNIGISVLHAGKQLSSFSGAPETIPVDIRLGINHRLRGLPLLLSFSLNRLADKSEANFVNHVVQNLSLGGELYLAKVFHVRFGYNNQRRRALAADVSPRLAGFSAGAGILINEFRVDYSVNAEGTVGIIQRFTVNVQW